MPLNRNLLGCQRFDAQVLPSGWDCAPLSEHIEFEYGFGLTEEIRRPGPYKVFGSNGVVGSHDEACVTGPGIIVGRKGTVGATTFTESPFWPIDTVYYVTKKKQDDWRYLSVLLRFLDLGRLNAATGVPGLSRRDALAIRGAFPPLEEQRSIAAVLDLADAAIERTREWLNLANRFRNGLLRQFLTCGLSNSSETWRSRFGPIPAHWNCVQLGSVIADGPTNGIYRPLSDYGEKGVPIVRITDFDSGCTKLPPSLRRLLIGPSDASRYELRNGDIVINRVNSLSHIGKSMLVFGIKEPTVFESNMMRFRLKESILPEFLIQVLQSRSISQQIQARAKPAVNQASINQSDVRRFWIPQPPVDEQCAIVRLLDSQTALRTAVESKLSLLMALKRGLMQDLLTGKVRVSASLEVAGA
jgi:type I restriction enzyme S subunit